MGKRVLTLVLHNCKCLSSGEAGATGAFPVNSDHRPALDPFSFTRCTQTSPFASSENYDADLTLSICRILCFLLLRLCFRMSRDEVLCSVELLNLRETESKRNSVKPSPLHSSAPALTKIKNIQPYRTQVIELALSQGKRCQSPRPCAQSSNHLQE